jgi:hypothetical protein
MKFMNCLVKLYEVCRVSRTSQEQKDSRISEMTVVKSWVISKVGEESETGRVRAF